MPPLYMSAARRRSVESNLFWAAHQAVEPWSQFRWHSAAGEACDTYKEHSSQALAIDVFGSIKMSPRRDHILQRLAAWLGLPDEGPWEVQLEWCDPRNHLREPHPTWADAVARSPRSLIYFECKFCEPDGGKCSQTRPRLRAACNGHYTLQAGPDGEQARCALSAKGFRYWEVIPEVFYYDAEASYFPCPFAGPWFQWMRNLATCWASARALGLRPAFVLVYADGPGLPMAGRVRSAGWERLTAAVRPEAIAFQAVSFQSVVETARRSAPRDPVWPELAAWVQRKIDSVCRARNIESSEI